MTNIGTDPTRSRVEQREIILSNKVALLLFPFTLVAMGFSFSIGALPVLISFSIFFGFLVSAFTFNKFGFNFIARLTLSAVPPLILIFPFFIGELGPDMNYHPFSYIFIGLVIIPLIMFYRKSEKGVLAFLLLIHLSTLVYFDALMGEVSDDLLLYTIPQLAFWVLMVTAFQFLKRESRLVEDDLKKSNEALHQSNHEIHLQKEEIITQNEFLNSKQLKIEEQASVLERKNHELNNTKIVLLKMIDKLREAKEKLMQKEAEAKSILSAIDEHYLVAQYDLNGRLVSINQKVKMLLGEIKLEKLKIVNTKTSHNVSNSAEKNSGFRKLWPKIVQGRALTIDIEIPLDDGPKYFSTTLAPLFDPKGNPYRVLAIGQDISELIEKNEKIDKINDELKEKISEISQQNQLLNFQQMEIFTKNEELKTQSEEIKAINESLEHRVRERTQVLEEKNMQLAEYAFINSHVLRAPVSTMMGLINLISYSTLPLEDQKIYNHLLETAEILDSIIFKINSAIEDGAHFDRNYLEPEREFHPMR